METESPLPRRRTIRLREYDYSQAGAYFVTICACGRRCLFGNIEDVQMRSNALGSIIEDEWFRSAEIRPHIGLDAFVVMPNHIHGIVLLESEPAPIRPGKAAGPPRGSLGSFVGSFKAAVTRRTSLPHPVWQRNYYEHIIRSEASLNAIREYIANNPASWLFDRQNPQGMKPSKRPAVWQV
jgi:REP element-mobilizing transposase RayT